jgi:hypothetical protein
MGVEVAPEPWATSAEHILAGNFHSFARLRRVGPAAIGPTGTSDYAHQASLNYLRCFRRQEFADRKGVWLVVELIQQLGARNIDYHVIGL